MLKDKSYPHEKIKSLYSFVKNNDLENFKKLVTEDKKLLMMKNNKGNNLLFYCLDNKSMEIFNFILNKKPIFLLEKNIDGFNCFTSLVNKSSFKNIQHFLENSSEENKKLLSSSIDNDGNNLLMQMLKKGKSFYNIYQNVFDKYEETYTHINKDGQTIVHLIALNDADYALNILDKPQFKKINKKNNRSVTAFLLASRHSSFELFKIIAEKSDIFEKTDLLSNAFHFAAYHGNLDKLYYLLENGLNPNEKNLYDNTALSTSLIEKNFDFSLALLKVVNQVEFEDVMYIVRSTDKNPSLFSYLMKNEKLLLNTLSDDAKKDKFLTYVFYYAPESLINENKKFLSNIVKKDSNLLNALFFSSIAGRRDFLFKVNFLIENYGWNNIENSTFKNFAKDYPTGFIYALNQLPKNQLEYLIKNSKIMENINNEDYIVLKVICIGKNSQIFNKANKSYDFSCFENTSSILDLISKFSAEKIINNIDFFEEMKSSSEITNLLSEKLAHYVFYGEAPITQFKDLFTKIKNIKIKKDIYIKLNEILLSENKPSDLELIFKNKYTIMENVLNNILKEKPNKFKNFKYLLDNPEINLTPSSAWSFLRENEFNKKSFFVIDKAPEILSFIKSIKLSEEDYISSDFFKLLMQISKKNEKTELFLSFLDYSSKHDNIVSSTYNYYFTNFNEKEKKHIANLALKNYLKEGKNYDIYQFIEKKYLNYYTIESLNKNILNTEKIDCIYDRLNSNNSYINIFNSYLSKQFISINILNLDLFKNNINIIKEKMSDFSENCLKDFMNSKIEDSNLMGLSKILNESKSQDLELHRLVTKRLELFLAKDLAVGEFFQQTVEAIIFNKNSLIQDLILNNDKINNSTYLSDKQKKYIFAQKLDKKLHENKTVRKVIKI